MGPRTYFPGLWSRGAVPLPIGGASTEESGNLPDSGWHMTDLASNQRIGTEVRPDAVPSGVAAVIAEHTNEFHSLGDTDNRLVWVSDSVQAVLGYQASDFLLHVAVSIIHPEDYPRTATAFHELVNEPNGRRRVQYRVRHSDGTWRWVETVMTNLLDRAGVNGVVSTTRDVTSRVMAKRRLAQSERRLRSIVSSAGDVVAILDSVRKVDYVTPTVAALLKRSTAAVKHDWTSFVHADDLTALDALFESALRHSGITQGPIDLRMLRSDGEWLTLEALITDYQADPIVRGVVLNARDVTSRRRIEAERSRNQNMFNALVEMAPVGIFLADSSGDWNYANAKISSEFGVEPAALLGKGWMQLFDAADVVRLKSELARWDGRGRYITELFTRHSPDTREVKVTISRPESAGMVGTIEDVTSRRELDEMLIDGAALGSLAGAVGSAAHDIHNLLSSIGFQLGLLDAAEEVDRVSAANEAIDRACDITEDLMAMSRPSRGRVAAIDLGPMITSLADMLGVLVEHQADLVVEHPGDGIFVSADRTGLERVITNLVVNARDAVEPRGRITIAVSEVDLDDESAPTGGSAGPHVAIAVADDGCGIPESVIGRIFEPYFTTKADGNGIGLAASRRNVRTWGGDIRISSVERKGTRVTILLPSGSNLD